MRPNTDECAFNVKTQSAANDRLLRHIMAIQSTQYYSAVFVQNSGQNQWARSVCGHEVVMRTAWTWFKAVFIMDKITIKPKKTTKLVEMTEKKDSKAIKTNAVLTLIERTEQLLLRQYNLRLSAELRRFIASLFFCVDDFLDTKCLHFYGLITPEKHLKSGPITDWPHTNKTYLHIIVWLDLWLLF